MQSGNRAICARAAGAAGVSALALALALTFGAAQAQDKTFVMKVTLPTINDAPHQFAKDFAALVEKDSGGRIKGEVYPASQLGSIPRQIEGTQLGAEKGLHGAGLMMAQPTCIISKTPLRHLGDFKGKKLRIFASQFQSVAFDRLGVTPVAMTLGDVLPALQQGAIDGAIAGIGPFVHLHFGDAAKYVTEANTPAIFIILEVSQKWYDSLPKDLQDIVDRDGAAVSKSIEPAALTMYQEQRKAWVDAGGELISLPREEQASMMASLSSVGEDVSKPKPALHEAYQIVTDAAKRTRQAPSQ